MCVRTMSVIASLSILAAWQADAQDAPLQCFGSPNDCRWVAAAVLAIRPPHLNRR
jgi:hypothetical protein